MSRKPLSPATLAQAERWYARLKAPDCSTLERTEFQSWRTTPENAAAYSQTERLWASLGQLAERPELEQLSQSVLVDTALRPQQRFAAAASIAAIGLITLLGGGALFLYEQTRDTPAVVYTTKPGERSIIKLADGSQLVLNYATELDVRLDSRSRRLNLRKGDALFTVAQDATRPFKVIVAGGSVTALGTRFEVRSDAQDVAVTLLEGSVAVDRDKMKGHVQLEPGDQIRFATASARIIRRKVDPEVVASWSTGRLRFRATPLAEALEEVNRYSTRPIRIDDPRLSSTPISGTFELGDSASVVAALQALLPVQASQQDDQILLRRTH